MEDLVLTDEEEALVTEGEAAASLLESPIFLVAIDRVRKQCAEKILESAPHDGGTREHLYNLSRGLSAVTEELLAIQALGTTVLDNATRPTGDDLERDEPDPSFDY